MFDKIQLIYILHMITVQIDIAVKKGSLITKDIYNIYRVDNI